MQKNYAELNADSELKDQKKKKQNKSKKIQFECLVFIWWFDFRWSEEILSNHNCRWAGLESGMSPLVRAPYLTMTPPHQYLQFLVKTMYAKNNIHCKSTIYYNTNTQENFRM